MTARAMPSAIQEMMRPPLLIERSLPLLQCLRKQMVAGGSLSPSLKTRPDALQDLGVPNRVWMLRVSLLAFQTAVVWRAAVASHVAVTTTRADRWGRDDHHAAGRIRRTVGRLIAILRW